MRLRSRLTMLMLLVLVIGLGAGLLATRLRPAPNPHLHAEGSYVLHNESEWAVVLQVESSRSPSRSVRLQAGESLVLFQKPSKVAVMLRCAGQTEASTHQAVLWLDPGREGSASDDYGTLEVITPRCLAIRMRLGRGAEPPVE